MNVTSLVARDPSTGLPEPAPIGRGRMTLLFRFLFRKGVINFCVLVLIKETDEELSFFNSTFNGYIIHSDKAYKPYIAMIKEAKLVSREKADRDDMAFWKGKSPQERLSYLQDLREQHFQLFNKKDTYNEARKGLRRVYNIVKRT